MINFYVSLELTIPKELTSDDSFISQCQEDLKRRNTLAMFGKFGSGKRTLAAQIAMRLAKKNWKLKIKIVRDGDVTSENFGSMHSTIIIIHNPIRTWFTSKHTDDIVDCLSRICLVAQKNTCYIIAIFHFDNWESFLMQIRENSTTIERMFPTKKHVCYSKEKLTKMALVKNKNISNQTAKISENSIGSTLITSLYLRNSDFEHQLFFNNPTEFIFEKLKNLEKSPNNRNKLAFKVMVFFVLHGGEIAKTDLDDIVQNTLCADLKRMNDIESIESIKQLLGLFIEEMVDSRSYRIVHDIITRCTFLAALENHMTLLLKICDPILIFDCLQVKSNQLAFGFIDKTVEISPKKYQEIATLFFQRIEMRNALLNNILFENKNFQDMWKKAEYITNKRHEQNKTEESCILL